MEPREIINNGKEGAAMTQDYDISEEPWFDTYREMMTIFLKQGGVVEEVSMQVREDDLHITLIGADNNMLYMRLGDFFLGKTRPAIRGNYVVRARSNGDALVHAKEILRTAREIEEANDHNFRSDIEGAFRRVDLSQQDSNRYGGRTVLSDLNGEAILSIGLASMALPIRANRVIASVNALHAITTDNTDGPISVGMMEYLNWYEDNVNTPPSPRRDLPLVLHVLTRSTSPYGWNSGTVSDVSLVCNYNTGIVYEATDSPWDLTDIKFLGAVESGGIKRALSKTAKKRPFGQLELHYSSEKSKARLKVMNLKGEEGEREYEEATLRFKDVGLVYEREPGQHVACADYGTIFDQFLSTRQGNPSIGRAIATAKENDPEATITELIGISARDELVIGFQHRSMTIACTMAGISRQAEFDDEYLGTSRAEDMRRTSEFYRTEESEEDEEPQTVEHQEPPSALYMKWKIYSDEWHQARGLPLPTDVGPVFMTYMNSGEMTDEDIAEYNRLLEE